MRQWFIALDIGGTTWDVHWVQVVTLPHVWSANCLWVDTKCYQLSNKAPSAATNLDLMQLLMRNVISLNFPSQTYVIFLNWFQAPATQELQQIWESWMRVGSFCSGELSLCSVLHSPYHSCSRSQTLANLAKIGDTGGLVFVFHKAMIVVRNPIFFLFSFSFIVVVFALFHIFLFSLSVDLWSIFFFLC